MTSSLDALSEDETMDNDQLYMVHTRCVQQHPHIGCMSSI